MAGLYCALFWIQGKTVHIIGTRFRDCTVPYFGFKAKLTPSHMLIMSIVLCLILDSRQNAKWAFGLGKSIVLCLILDSRQNYATDARMMDLIVLCLILDSRQN